MAPPTTPRLLRHIRKLENQLQSLHQSRQKRLAKLTRRRNALLGLLAKIEDDLSVLGEPLPEAPAAETADVSAVPSGRRRRRGKKTLANVLIAVLHDAGPGAAMTVRELAQAAKKRGYKTKSEKFGKSVETRVQDMKRHGLLKRAVGQRGYVLGDAATVAAVGEPGTNGAVKSGRRKKRHREGPSLKAVIRDILSKSDPLTAEEIAEAVVKSGYKSVSKNLKNVVWVTLKKVVGIKSVPDNKWTVK